MFNIGQYFGKFLKGQARELSFRSEICTLINTATSLDISVKNISIKGGVITIKNISQAARSAIFIKKQNLLLNINQVQKVYVVKDIR